MRLRAAVVPTVRVLADTVDSSGPPPHVVPADKEDVLLVERIAGGEAESLGELYDRYGRVAFGMLYRMLPGPEAAEEVAQDAFHAVWRRAGSFRPGPRANRTRLREVWRNAPVDRRRPRGRGTA